MEHVAPHLLGIFMLALACIPLVFVLQDRRRRRLDAERAGRLRREARVAEELRSRRVAGAMQPGWMTNAARR
ncbi:hypothetical protein [Roseococcus sp. YIM B11640]|uniref:hypothetical protein n=1 Tax=Roseococcus sp. YIM B11640 TaxID=3133973 RepID=UPI003C7CEAF3